MHIRLNGQDTELPDDLAIAALIERLGLVGRRLAIEVNGEIVPRSAHATHRLAADDRVEVVHAIGGG